MAAASVSDVRRPGRTDRLRSIPARAGTAILLVGALTACGSNAPHQRTGLGPLPSYLRTATAQPVDRIVTATHARPQLAVQGVAVDVDLPTGRVQALVSGPAVPPFVTPPPPSVTAVFTITLAHTSGTVPVRLSDISITDQLGRSFHPTLVVGEKPPPATAPTGSTLTFRVTAVMPTGEGRIYWSPGGKPIVGWDFIVEND